jgi:hypothetical protein
VLSGTELKATNILVISPFSIFSERDPLWTKKILLFLQKRGEEESYGNHPGHHLGPSVDWRPAHLGPQ